MLVKRKMRNVQILRPFRDVNGEFLDLGQKALGVYMAPKA